MTFCKAQQRPQALPPIRRVATDMGLTRCGAAPCPFPPAPPHDGKPAAGGKAGKSRGAVIAFCNLGSRRVCQKPVDHPLCNLVTPRGTKRNPHTVNFGFPRVVPFCPRVGSNLPPVVFCDFCAAPLSISSFSLRKEREERGRTAESASTGLKLVKKSHPRVCYKSDSKSVDEIANLWSAGLYKSRTYEDSPGFPRSTGKNAYTPRQVALNHLGLTLGYLVPTALFMVHNLAVSAKKALIGCGSPKARGAKPHPARFAAFLFLARLGGPNGRAQALPVTLRVPRSSTPVRAAAQCGSWSAVVHLAQLEINTMARTAPTTPSIGCNSVFNPRLEHDSRENIVELAESLHTNSRDPYNALLAILQLLRNGEARAHVESYGLQMLLEPIVAQLDTLSCEAGTLLHSLAPEVFDQGGLR